MSIEYRQLENGEEIYSDDYILADTYRQCGPSYYRKTPADFPDMEFYRKSYNDKPFGSKFD